MNKKILIGVISNQKSWPVYFCRSMYELYGYTKDIGDVELRTFSAVEIQQMRNMCCNYAIKNNFDYVFMLDTDMIYPMDSIEKLIAHDKDFVVGSATQRNAPFYPTQYKKLEGCVFKSKENRVFITKEDRELIEIESTGVVGALIKIDTLKKLEYPYFKFVYKDGEGVIGSDVYFCKKIRDSKIKIYLDPNVNYKHEVLSFSDSFGVNPIVF